MSQGVLWLPAFQQPSLHLGFSTLDFQKYKIKKSFQATKGVVVSYKSEKLLQSASKPTFGVPTFLTCALLAGVSGFALSF